MNEQAKRPALAIPFVQATARTCRSNRGSEMLVRVHVLCVLAQTLTKREICKLAETSKAQVNFCNSFAFCLGLV